MSEPEEIRGNAVFTSDGQLLAELGERLMSTPQVALAELIKNAYDADATRVHVWLEKKPVPGLEVEEKPAHILNIWDNGHGMTRDEFLAGWMVIASPVKLRGEVSPKYHRPFTGSKGVGRFAVRFLGRSLQLRTVARDKTGAWGRLKSDFDWELLAVAPELSKVEIPYEVRFGIDPADRGTLLRIDSLQEDWDEEILQVVSGHLLDIVSPQAFTWLAKDLRPKDDPGFRVYFGPPGEEQDAPEAGSEVLDRWVGRVRLSVRGDHARLRYQFNGEKRTFTLHLSRNLVGSVAGEIRYFPRRTGVFRGLSTIDGRHARSWFTKHSGVRVIDRGFRMLPYGEKDDDWLNLSASKAAREREWGSHFTEMLYPAAERNKRETSDPLLKVPANHQLIGAVAVESHRPPRESSSLPRQQGLQPAMDRQGFVENKGFEQLRGIVRTAVELFAIIDVEVAEKRKEQEARRRVSDLRNRIMAAVEEVRSNPEISPSTKRDLIRTYEEVASQLGHLQEAHEEAQEAVETMSLLGMLSAFMTHEVTEMLRSVKRMLRNWKSIPVQLRGAEHEQAVEATEEAYEHLKKHIDYAKTFVGAVRAGSKSPFEARSQVSLVVRQVENVAKNRRIEFENRVPADVLVPAIGVAVYSGTLLNLLTNAVKAILAKSGRSGGTILIETEDSDQAHTLRVSDDGVGVPDEISELVFLPLFSTTAGDGPFGPGMGLGLYIVRRVLKRLGGGLDLVEPPEGFTTTFEARFPR